MTAFILLVLLLGGAAAYVSWAWLAIAHGASWWWFVVGAPLAYVAPAIVLTAWWFTLAWIWRTPRPPSAKLGLWASVRLYLGEIGALAVSWPSIALHGFFVRDPAPAPALHPIVLVHGVLVNDGVWVALRAALTRARVGPIYTVNYGPTLDDIEVFARQLAAKIDAVRAATGATRVCLIAHSMGGLVARSYMRRFGCANLAQIITIGTPHHGSMLARMFPGRCLGQMRPGNAWLVELNRNEAIAAAVPVTSIWSRHDSMVAPQASAELAAATNIAFTGIGHNALLNDNATQALIVRLVGEHASRMATTQV